MKKQKWMNVLSLICNGAILMLVTYSVACFFFAKPGSSIGIRGAVCLRYFMVLSNILAAVGATCVFYYNMRSMTLKEVLWTPHWVSALKYVGTGAVTVQMLMALTFLGATQGFDKAFAGNNLFLNLLVPILSLVSMLVAERSAEKDPGFLFVIPTAVTALYFLVYSLSVNGEAWQDFYGFKDNGGLLIVSVGVVLVSLAVSFLLSKIRSLGNKKNYIHTT